jgi:hypothetical protein
VRFSACARFGCCSRPPCGQLRETGRSERPVPAPPWTPPQPGGLPRPPSHGRGHARVMHRRCVTAGVPLPGAGRRATWPGLVRAPAALVGFDPSRCCSRPRVSGRFRPSDPPAVSPAARTDNRAAPLGVTRNVCRFAGGIARLYGRWLPVTRATSRGVPTGATRRRDLPPAAGLPAAAPGLRPRGRSVPGRAPPSDGRPTGFPGADVFDGAPPSPIPPWAFASPRCP